MTERVNPESEIQKTPTRDEIIKSFVERRQNLNAELDQAEKQYGGTLDALQLIERNKKRKELPAEIDALDQEWYALGGAEIETAEQAKAKLNFRSTANDRIEADAQLRNAKNTFYENFLASEEVAKLEAESLDEAGKFDDEPLSDEAGDHPELQLDSDYLGYEDGEKRESQDAVDQLDDDYLHRTETTSDELDTDYIVNDDEKYKLDTDYLSDDESGSSRLARAKQNLQDSLGNPLLRLAAWAETRRAADSERSRRTSRRMAIGAAALTAAMVGTKLWLSYKGHHIEGGGSSGNVITEPDLTPSVPDISSNSPTGSTHEILNPSEAYTVRSGEGWNQTFKEMGIPKSQWDGVLQDAGPKLQEQGWAYFDKGHGEWRISQPGKLPENVMTTLKDASAKNGYRLAS